MDLRDDPYGELRDERDRPEFDSGVRDYALGKGGAADPDAGLPDWGDPPVVQEADAGSEILAWVLACVLIGAALLFLHAISKWDPKEKPKPNPDIQRLLHGG